MSTRSNKYPQHYLSGDLQDRRSQMKTPRMRMNVGLRSLAPLVPLVAMAFAQTPMAARAEPLPPSPFTTTLSNHTPLVFGMSIEDATDALGQPLGYVSGTPGNEIFLVIRNVGGSRWSFRDDQLFLQFRGGRLTGWKADWSRNWMWR